MAGYREFMPGQVWFYYNMSASKELEKKKELGACTNRPVVIIQAAFYPEWNDIITVCPITSSDRRSGVFIESTIFKDGSLIEGGTILPYLFFNVKVKFLYPLITSSHKRKILSLAPQDFEKVKEGFLYHLGVGTTVPSYIENWKHLNDFDRSIVIRDVRLAINDYEEICYDTYRANVDNVVKKSTPNPVVMQTPPSDSDKVENHIIASLDHYDRQRKILYEGDGTVEQTTESSIEESGRVKDVNVKLDRHITFSKMTTESFAHLLRETMGGFYPVMGLSQIYPGSTILADLTRDPKAALSIEDQLKLTTMTTKEIMAQTGIPSDATAYRVRRLLREQDWGGFAHYDETVKKMCIEQNAFTAPFLYTGEFPLSKSIVRRVAKLRKQFFSMTKEQVYGIMAMPDTDRKKLPVFHNKSTLINRFMNDAISFYHFGNEEEGFNQKTLNDLSEDAEVVTAIEETTTEAQSKDGIVPIYDLWETLSPQEIREIKSCNKKNIGNVAKNFGITKDKARALRGQVLDMTSKAPSRHQPHVTVDPKEVCASVILHTCTDIQSMMIFCRTDPGVIATVYSELKCDNTPSKAEIRKMKLMTRQAIVKDCNWR